MCHTGTVLKSRAESYAHENNFVVSIGNSLYFQPQERQQALEKAKTLPLDNMKYIQIICSKGGGPKAKKTKQATADELPIKMVKTRSRTSEKCGCKWVVSGSWNFDDKCFKVVTAKLEHTDGCNPTPAQQRVMLRKKTRGKVERMAPAVLNSIREMMYDKFPLPIIRKRIRNKIPVTLLTDAVFFRNLKLKFDRDRQKGILPTVSESDTVDNSDLKEDESILEAVSVASATRSLIAPTLAYEGVKIIYILQKLRTAVPGFEYRLFVDENTKQLAGWVYMTPRQRAAMQKCGQVLFIDTKAKGTNLHNFPFFAPAIVNQDGKHEVVLYGCVCTASNAAVEWVLRSIVDMCPQCLQVCRTIFTDDAVSDDTIHSVFTNVAHLLCAFHIIDLNIYKVAKKCRYAHAERLRTMLWLKVAQARTVRDTEQAMRALEHLRVPKQLALSLRYWFGKVSQWAGPYIKNHFTLNFNGNTMGEVSFAAVMKWVSTPDQFEQLFFLLTGKRVDIILSSSGAC